jgi:hypothetical protein
MSLAIRSANRGGDLYHHDGHHLFVIDGHSILGRQPRELKNNIRSWIKCFYAYTVPSARLRRCGHSTNFAATADALVDDLFRTGMSIWASSIDLLYEFYRTVTARSNNAAAGHLTVFYQAVRRPAREAADLDAFRRMVAEYRSVGWGLYTAGGATARAAGGSTTRGPTNI